jgi:sugar phosphate isomerase/epimerase
MNIGIVHFMAFPEGDPVEQIRYLGEDDFFDVVEIKPYDQPVMEEIKSICDQAGMSIGIGAQPGLLGGKLSLNDPDEAGRTAAIDSVKGAIDAGYMMDAKIVACLSGPMPDDEADISAEVDLMVDSCVQLCNYAKEKAEDYCIYLSVEQFDDTTDKKCLIGPNDITIQMAERVKEQVDNFGITADLSHLPMLPGGTEEILAGLAPHLIHMHAGNCVSADEGLHLYGDLHPRFGYPGGENDVPELVEFLEALINTGYFRKDVPTDKPVLTFEVKPYDGDTSELLIAHTKRTFKRAWAQL